ncbi:hypothetical protein MAR_030141 [Mya arenaria]|uniref:FADD n=1 Tax=Mya arenaria TaxID=6604 RepID=A0ABY7DKI4_MYAAR|nr:uncharacterized protein LOC128244830 [Mya arenaria]WAQ97451.1 hypothetical protein MAR_030141 [Mya arenaria]
MADQLEKYRDVLLEISHCIDENDLSKMKFVSLDKIKKKQSEKILNPLQFFTALEERGFLGQNNLSYLKNLLQKCCAGKVNGLRILELYEQGLIQGIPLYDTPQGATFNLPGPGVPNGGHPGQSQVIYVVHEPGRVPDGNLNGRQERQIYNGPDLSEETDFLTNNLGRDWKFYMRALGIHDNDIDSVSHDYTSMRERIRQCLLLWQQEQQQNANRIKLINACKHSSVRRMDLACKIEDGSFRNER